MTKTLLNFAKIGMLCLVALVATPTWSADEEPAPPVKFIDIGRFDTDLAKTLQASKGEVNVNFYENVSPNNVPVRLQKWLNAAEKSGGVINVSPPPGDMVPKNPAVLFGLLGSLWSTLKAWTEISEERMLKAADGRSVTIQLERGKQEEILIKAVSFSAKP